MSARSAVAGNEHSLAAGEFSNAAKATGDREVRAKAIVVKYVLMRPGFEDSTPSRGAPPQASTYC